MPTFKSRWPIKVKRDGLRINTNKSRHLAAARWWEKALHQYSQGDTLAADPCNTTQTSARAAITMRICKVCHLYGFLIVTHQLWTNSRRIKSLMLSSMRPKENRIKNNRANGKISRQLAWVIHSSLAQPKPSTKMLWEAVHEALGLSEPMGVKACISQRMIRWTSWSLRTTRQLSAI